MNEAETLYRLLMELAQIGAPTLRQMGTGGWHADVKFPAPKGCTAEVCSDFKHRTPVEALQCCRDRLGGLRNMISVPSPSVGLAHLEIIK